MKKKRNQYIITFNRNMTEENVSQEFRIIKIDETRNYFLEETKNNYLVTKKRNNVCTALNYIKNLLLLVSAVTGCVSITAVVCLVAIPIGITSSAVRLNVFPVIVGIKHYTSMIKKKEIIMKA